MIYLMLFVVVFAFAAIIVSIALHFRDRRLARRQQQQILNRFAAACPDPTGK